MQLAEKETDLFFSLYHPLLTYVNKQFAIIEGIDKPEDLKEFPVEGLNAIREKLYDSPEIIDSFVRENPYQLSPDNIKIVESWKNFKKESFYIFRYLKKYTIFLNQHEPTKAYGVLALNDSFEEMFWGRPLPIMVEAVLLPFKDKIIYDGILSLYSLYFGGGIRQSLNDAYNEAKARFGIITSLTFPEEELEQSDEELLKFYLKNANNRKKYWDEIQELIEKDSNLKILYHQELGKVHGRKYAKRLREIGLAKAWIALYEEMPIASEATKAELEGILKKLLPPEKRKLVYIFQLKAK
ncbi:MAG: hypothetical protein AB4426_32920 [Xenococcaceae cyanobacterium]